MRLLGMALIMAMGFNLSAQASSRSVDHATLKRIQADVEEAEQNNDNLASLGGSALDQSDLKGQALKDYKKLMKIFGSDYPAEVSAVKIEGQNLIMIIENNDGGGEVDFYSTDGANLTSFSGGESDEWTWSN